MSVIYDAVIIGGGASGLIAAITAAENNPKLQIAILEKNSRVGKKLLTTGNGRCNLTNLDQNIGHYHGKNSWFIQQVLNQFSLDDTLSFFKRIGVETVTEKGKVFPYSLQATSVLDLLRFHLEKLNISEICDFPCTDIKKDADLFVITGKNHERILSKTVLIATGGNAAPQTGSTGDGYAFLQKFGHRLCPVRPALVQVRVLNKKTLPLKGIKVNASISVFDKEELLASEYGEVLFTDYGLSGPPILQLSRFVSSAEKATFRFCLDLFPNLSLDELKTMLEERKSRLPARLLLTGLLHNTISREVLKEAGTDDTSALACFLKEWPFTVCGTLDWQHAQTTMGGIELTAFSPLTLSSKLVDGLYACGEVLDVFGDCGGYNLQWAWSSGTVSGRAIAKRK